MIVLLLCKNKLSEKFQQTYCYSINITKIWNWQNIIYFPLGIVFFYFLTFHLFYIIFTQHAHGQHHHQHYYHYLFNESINTKIGTAKIANINNFLFFFCRWGSPCCWKLVEEFFFRQQQHLQKKNRTRNAIIAIKAHINMNLNLSSIGIKPAVLSSKLHLRIKK